MQETTKFIKNLFFTIIPSLAVAYFAINGLLYKAGYFDADTQDKFPKEEPIAHLQEKANKVVEETREPAIKTAQQNQSIQEINDDDIKDFTVQRATEYGIDPKIIDTIIKIESSNNRYAIGVISDNSREIYDGLNNEENRKYINMKISSNERFISFMPKNKEVAEQLFDYLNENKEALNIKTMDYGIMQINHDTINGYGLDQKEIFLNPFYNVALGIDVLQTCFKKFPTSQFYTIECYNKGLSENRLVNLDYYDKFIAQYNKN